MLGVRLIGFRRAPTKLEGRRPNEDFRPYSDFMLLNPPLASLYEYGREDSWIGFKAVLGGDKLTDPSNYKAIESGHCTGSALNWAPDEPNHYQIQECVQNYAGSSDSMATYDG
ncbi:hypothetical protein DICVIV_12992 [Dictyocaulus viviparus]|uniref:Uncharacterized protein n=1 Tax=Dictyocaulus viviparus TaxID=29172 RepID=A0A0D8XBK8_DICVI|nr:hypothetical protein DICVIV_12992 [Dictyocaulus viviparus]